ncbi:MAG: vitamin B12-dependent ribonucleotide reductase [Candidatus Sericytochromatia bacterium]|nr:vitamin B12-dependent ribonucleotide reductase [Candidatus Sericytochromatia bacterium]
MEHFSTLLKKPIALTDNGRRVLEKRYLVKGDDGQVIETPEEMFLRVAKTVAGAEAAFGKTTEEIDELTGRFYLLMADLKFMPNSPTLMNAGRPLGMLSACFVLPVPDDMAGIFETMKHAAMVQKAGGGTGFSFSRLRPAGDVVRSTMGVSSGPVSFMEAFNGATEVIKQGSTRRGANMGILRVDHPDIETFIACKDDITKITNFNISVALTEAFMDAVEKDAEYDIINPRDGQPVRKERARKIFEKIYNHAWQTGEPGIVFIDRINNDHPVKGQAIESTNPCGEQPLAPYESCNLGSVNVAKHLNAAKNDFDWSDLEQTVRLTTRFLDDIIEANTYPIPEITRETKANRRIGLGVMGWADAIIELGVPYNSKEGVALGKKLMKFIDETANQESITLGQDRGSFPNFERSTWKDQGRPAMRNVTVTTIAPTGTISIIAGCSGGIEPLFAVSFKRFQANMHMIDVNPAFEKVAKEKGFYSESLMAEIAATGSVAHVADVPDEVKQVFVTSHDISPEWHVRMQAAFQEHTQSAVSKTINMSYEATPEDVRETYWLAYKLNCKGITVYRDGSRTDQVLSTGNTGTSSQTAPVAVVPAVVKVRNRPKMLQGYTYSWQVGDERVYITVNTDDQGVREVFINAGKCGSDVFSLCEALGILISGMLKEGMGTRLIKEKLRGIKASTTLNEGGFIHSIPDAIAVSIQMVEEGVSSLTDLGKGLKLIAGPACPECRGALSMEQGCMSCNSCGYSKCS